MSGMPWVVRPLEPWIGPSWRGLRRMSPFSATWPTTLDLLDREIWHLGGRKWVLQIDVPEKWINRDGTLSARATVTTPAVRVSFDSDHGPLTYGCDRFTKWQDNIRAIALSLEALRKVDRYGVAGRGEQYTGWQAISARPAEMTPEQAAEFIAQWAEPDDAERRTTIVGAILFGDGEMLKAAYRAAAKRTHPDLTGDVDTFKRLNVARDLLDREAA